MPPRIEQSYARSKDYLNSKVSADKKAYYRSLYPEGLNLTPGSEQHDRLRDMVMERANESERYMQSNHSTWRYLDEMCNVYIPPTEEQRVKAQRDPDRPVNVVIPEMYATRETIMTYMMAAFGGTGELFKYRGRSPEDILGAIMLERIIAAQTQRGKALLALHTEMQDGFTYGFGAMACGWTVRSGYRTVTQPVGITDPFAGFIPTGMKQVREPAIIYEGNEFSAIDPYYALPDPTVPITEVQKMEYFGWKSTEAYVNLKKMEAEPGSMFINVDYLKEIENGQSSIYKVKPSGRDKKVNVQEERYGATNKHDLLWFYLNFIPNDEGLGPVDVPEKWLVCLAADQIIIAAVPLELDHDMIPVATLAPDHSGHEFMPISRLEIISGLQHVVNFYYNSHITNVLRAVNNVLIADPKLVNMPDLRENRRIIRTRPTVWGRGVKDAIEQLQVYDVTGNHMNDLLLSRDVIRNVSGAVDSLQGLQRRGGERVTAQEFSSTRSSALSRLQTAAMRISLQNMYDLALMAAFHTQQFLSVPTYASVAGRWEMVLRQEYGILDPSIPVDPFSIDINFDVEVEDGTIEGGEFADQWIQLMQVIQSNPELMQTMDSTRIFLHVARLMKAQNAFDFVRKAALLQPTIAPDQQVMQQAQAGNLIPFDGGANANADAV